MRIADRVAYINHDIDDAVRAGVLKEEDLPKDCIALLGATHSERIAHMVCDIVDFSDNQNLVDMSPEVSAATDKLKEFLFETVYWNPNVEGTELAKAQRIVRDLFHCYMDHPELMQGKLELQETNMEERAQAVCDYIAGMTDRYAVSRFIKHFLPRGANINELE